MTVIVQASSQSSVSSSLSPGEIVRTEGMAVSRAGAATMLRRGRNVRSGETAFSPFDGDVSPAGVMPASTTAAMQRPSATWNPVLPVTGEKRMARRRQGAASNETDALPAKRLAPIRSALPVSVMRRSIVPAAAAVTV